MDLYSFDKLRDFLIKRGFIVKQAEGYREIRPELITRETIRRGSIEFERDGIFVINPNGERYQVFLYKRDYRLQLYGKPRFHICKCKTIQEFINSGTFRQCYIRANSDPVPVNNIDNRNIEEMVEGLPLCQNCADIVRKYRSMNSSDFVELLKLVNGNDDEVKEVDLFGYTKDWERISKAYREKKDYTCEECGWHPTNRIDRQYIHCHHIDQNKLNNNEDNLKCLCIYCHSEIDANHKENLTTGANRIMYDDFMKKFKSETNK